MSDESEISTSNVTADDIFDGNMFAEDETPAEQETPENAVETAPEEIGNEVGKTEEEQPKETPPASPPAKKLEFKVGDQVVPLDETALVEWKVDGKPTPIAVKDLLQNYAGKIAWEKRLNDVALEKKSLRSERDTFSGERDRHRNLITDLHAKMGQGKTLEAVSTLVEMTGLKVDPREYVRELRGKLIEQAQQLAAMSETDRAKFELNEEREYLRAQQARWEQQREAEQAKKAFGTRLAKAIETSGVGEEEFVATQDWLKSRVKESGGDLGQVTPEYVATHLAEKKAYEIARDAIAAVEPDQITEHRTVKDEARWDKLAALVKAHPEFTAEEFAEMYRETRKTKLATSVSKKVQKAPTPTAATAALKAKPTQRKDSDFTKEAFGSADFDW